jgi:hypothetical protein
MVINQLVLLFSFIFSLFDNIFSVASSGCRAILLNVKHFISICASMGSIPDIIYKAGSGAFFGKESFLFRTDF